MQKKQGVFALVLGLFFCLVSSAAFAAGEAVGGVADVVSQFTVPIVVAVLVLAVMIIIGLFMRNYIKVPPNQAAVISGRKHKVRLTNGEMVEVGSRIVRGGATFKLPVVERVDYLNLEAMSIMIKTTNAITREGVPLSVAAIANVKIGGDDESLRNAAERFLGQSHDTIQGMIRSTLEAHLRAICGTMTVEDINSNRQAFNVRMMEESTGDLRKMGITIDVWSITHLEDSQGYLDALGKKRTAEVKRDADIGEAEATRDQQIRTAEASREAKIKASDAERQGNVAKADNDQQIAEANRNLATRQAQFDAEVAAANARRDQAGPKAKAEAEKEVFVAQVQAQEAQVVAQTALQDKVAAKVKKELEATILTQADAAREKAKIDADAAKQKLLIEAEAAKQRLTIEAEAAKTQADLQAQAAVMRADGEKKAAIAEGDGVAAKTKAIGIAEAEAQKAKLLAEAEGQAAQLKQRVLAEAEGEKAKLLAQAEGELRLADALKAKLLAEAEGKLKLAEAFKAMDEAGRLMFILQAAPAIIDAIGEAAAKALTPAFNSVGAGLGNIDKVVIMEQGGGQNGGGLKGFAMQGPSVVFELLQQCRMMGIDPSNLLKKIGLDVVADVGLAQSDAASVPGKAIAKTDGDKKD